MIAFIDDHRGAYGVEPICKVLPIAPSTYRAHAAKQADPTKLSARAKQDAIRKIEIRRVFAENFGVYGVRKVWRQLRREGADIARCTAERLMRSMGGLPRITPCRPALSLIVVLTAHASFVLDALEQALHDRRPVHRGGLVHHSDRGSQGGFKRSSQREFCSMPGIGQGLRLGSPTRGSFVVVR
jgi:transposase InsO family protein